MTVNVCAVPTGVVSAGPTIPPPVGGAVSMVIVVEALIAEAFPAASTASRVIAYMPGDSAGAVKVDPLANDPLIRLPLAKTRK